MSSRPTKLILCLAVPVVLTVGTGTTPAVAAVTAYRPTFTSPLSRTTVGPLPKFEGIRAYRGDFHILADGVALTGEYTNTKGPDLSKTPWSFQVTVAIADGPHAICIYDYDREIAYKTPSKCITVVVGVPNPAAPAAPVLIRPWGRSTNDTTPLFAGTGEPGATVTVTLDGVPLGRTPVRSDHTWSLPVTVPLSDGNYRLDVVQTDPEGNTSDPASREMQRIDTQAPTAPWIKSPVLGVGVVHQLRPTISGKAEVGSTVEVRLEDENGPVDTAGLMAGPNAHGEWRFCPQKVLAKTTHVAYVTQTDGAGNRSPVSKRTFTVGDEPEED